MTNLNVSEKSHGKTDVLNLEAGAKRCSVEKVFLEFSQNPQENSCASVSLSLRRATLLKKKTLAQVFSCEFCETSKNTFTYRKALVAASVN